MAGESSTTARNHLADAGVADLPEGWGVAEVGDLLADDRGISVGVMYPGDHCSDGIPLIKAGDLHGSIINTRPSFRISREKHHEYRRTELAGGELVMTLVGNVGQCAVVPLEMRGWNVARAVAVIRLRDPSDAHYVQQCLLSRPLQHLMEVWCNTTVQATLNLKEIRQLPLPWPPKSCRDAIARLGRMLDDKIELNRRMNATLEAMSRAIFKSWFVDFDPVRQKAAGKRPVGMDAQTAALFPDSFEDSEIGEVPKGWRLGTLEDVVECIETGGRPKGGVSGYTTGVPSIGAESIVGLGRFDFAKTKYVPREFFDRMSRGRVESRDVLLYKDGGRPGEFEPHVTLFGDGFPFAECAINEHVYRIRAKPEYGQAMLFFWLSSDLVMEEMRVKGTGVAIPGLNSTQAKSLTTLRPPVALTADFNRQVEPALARLLAACNESRTLAALRDTLLPKLLSGEVRVPEAEGMVEEAVG